MERLLTNLTASITELRNPRAIIEMAGDRPVAIFNRNKLEGYFVPVSAINKMSFTPAAEEEIKATLESTRPSS